GFPAEKSGIKSGERIQAINGKKITSAEEVTKVIKSKPDTELALELTDIDGNNPHNVKVTTQKTENGDGRIGVVFDPLPFKEYKTPTEKLFSGITYSWDITRLTFGGLGKLFSDLFQRNFDKVSASVSGPVGLAAQSE